MIIKTVIERYQDENVESYIGKPVLDDFTRVMDLNRGVITDNDNSKTIGVIRDAEIINDKVELTIELFDKKLRREFLGNNVISCSIS